MTQASLLPRCSVDGLSVFELTTEHVPLLQQFFDQNPEYFLAVQGEIAGPNEAHTELHDAPPEGFSYTKQVRLGWMNLDNSVSAMASIVTDLLARGVWHIGLFIVATARHGSGDAPKLYRDIEKWVHANGAEWLRLGVVLGNSRAERFWTTVGFKETRTRANIQMGNRTNTIRVMVKPLRGGSIDRYLELVPRDRPESA